jgi:hypothetical protein
MALSAATALMVLPAAIQAIRAAHYSKDFLNTRILHVHCRSLPAVEME